MSHAPLPHGAQFCAFSPGGASTAAPNSLVPLSYGLKGASRGKSSLTWSFTGTITGLTSPTTQITQAFGLWAKAAPLSFTKVNSNADISIVVGTTIQIGGAPALADTTSDGRTITVSNAYTFYTSGTGTTNDFLNTITHEIGHALGLLHANTPSSVMYPFVATNDSLQPDDTHAIQALYSWSPQKPLQGLTAAVPAICACGGTMMMAWRGEGSDMRIWVSTSTDGQNWTPQHPVNGANSLASPSLAWDGSRVWMAWRGSNEDSLWFATSTQFFGEPNPAIQHLSDRGSSDGPRIAIVGGVPSMVWKGTQDTGIYFSTYVGGKWGAQRNLGGIGSIYAPAICQDILGGARMVWRGTGTDDTLWTCIVPASGNPVQTRVSWPVLGNGSTVQSPGYPGTAAGPGLALASGRVVLVWRGIPNDDSLWFTQLAYDTLPAPTPKTEEWSNQASIPGAGAEVGGSVAEFNGLIYVVWKGIPGDSRIFTSTV